MAIKKKLLGFSLNNPQSSTSEEMRNKPHISMKDIAIIGVSARIASAQNTEQYWGILENGENCIREIPARRRKDLDAFVAAMEQEQEVNYAKYAYLDEIDSFDHELFNISPKEASLMDPNQRIFLETSWEALEDAGYGGHKLRGQRVGVFLGFSSFSSNEYFNHVSRLEPESFAASMTGNLAPVIAGRVSYLFDFKGPSLMIDTTCSSSLAAVHYACRSIRTGDCETALAGGIKINLLPFKYSNRMGIESSVDHTRTFDEASDGTGFGEGSAVILLKPLHKAIEDHDQIYAVIKGSAINQDGHSIGITAPNPDAQADVIVRAWQDAEVQPETISYIEAHGTGTKLGDPVEIEGINKAFSQFTSKKQFCAIGAVKSNIGHLDNAAGIAGLIKAVLALKHKKIPPSINFSFPNRKIDFENSPVYINDQLMPWETSAGELRRCGISSFGLSGTNCHVILEEAPCPESSENQASPVDYVFTLSANSVAALERLLRKYQHTDFAKHNLIDICYTATTGREHFACRIAFVARDVRELQRKLKAIDFNSRNKDGIFYSPHKTDRLNPLPDNQCFYNDLNRRQLEEICERYAGGEQINWNRLYSGAGAGRISLPTYPFERKRCWARLPAPALKQNVSQSDHLYYSHAWKRQERASLQTEQEEQNGTILVVTDGAGIGDYVLNRLREEGRPFIEWRGVGHQSYDQPENSLRLSEVSQIYHFASCMRTQACSDFGPVRDNLKQGISSFLGLIHALQDSRPAQSIEVTVISAYANEVTGDEKLLIPENAALFGLAKVVNQESKAIQCRCIDIDDETDAELIYKEIESGYQLHSAAFRNNQRYTEEISPQSLSTVPVQQWMLKEDGAYIIIGGTGGIGLEIAHFFSRQQIQVNLVLVNRSPFPEADKWAALLETSTDEALCHKIRTLLAIKENGSQVVCMRADVCQESEMKQLLAQVRSRFGRINGVVHSAAAGGDGLNISRESRLDLENVIAPKIYGTWILDKLTQDDDMDFFILFSSVASILGGKGLGYYSAANAYQDTFGAWRNRRGRKTTVINWTAWKETGMVSKNNLTESSILLRISNAEALEAFLQVLNRDIKRIVICKLSYTQELLLSEKYLPVTLSGEIRARVIHTLSASTSREPQTNFLPAAARPAGREDGETYTPLENKLAVIWSGLLGIDEVNIDKDFYDLGGNSLVAVKCELEMEKEHLSLSYEDVEKYRTIRKLALRAEKRTGECIVKETVKSGSTENKITDILLDIHPFNDVYYKSCFYNSLFPVIQYLKGSIIPFLLNDTIVYQIQRREDGVWPEARYLPRQSDSLLLQHAGIEFHAKSKSEKIIPDTMKAIQTGNPVILWIDCYYASIRKDLYETTHLPHTWLIYGYNEEERVFHIIEHPLRDNLAYDKKKVSFEEVTRAYNGYLANFMNFFDEYSYYEYYLSGTGERGVLSEPDDQINELKRCYLTGREAIAKGIMELEEYLCDENSRKLMANDQVLEGLNTLVNVKQVELYRLKLLFGSSHDEVKIVEDILNLWKAIRAKVAKNLFTGSSISLCTVFFTENIANIIELERVCLDKLSSV